MKKVKFLTSLSLSAIMIAGGLLGNNTYASDDWQAVKISYDTDGQYSECSFYDTSLYPDYCNNEVGTFDVSQNTLTLNNIGENALTLSINGTFSTPITIKTNNDININIFAQSDIILDLGEHRLFPNDGMSAVNVDTNLTVKSGNISVKSFTANNIVINGGNVTILSSLMPWDSFAMNGGIASIEASSFLTGNVTITNGTLNSGEISIVKDNGKFEMTGGTVTIEKKDDIHKDEGISAFWYNNKVIISGGKLHIKNFETGIKTLGSLGRHDDNTITFDGGETIIENASKYAVYADDNADPENSIVFGEDMGIKEPDTYVFWRKRTVYHDSGIVPNGNTVTIAKGYGYEKKEIDNTPGGDSADDKEEEADVKVPDTGVINSKEGGALAIFTATSFIILSVITMIGIHKKHTSGHFKYDK
jgi:hypothetical protein